uniref:Uncharacterized protein n=1 Tax=Arion vulgaris TaxID=1028688 RepID=A0A0B7AVM1_9EUPU
MLAKKFQRWKISHKQSPQSKLGCEAHVDLFFLNSHCVVANFLEKGAINSEHYVESHIKKWNISTPGLSSAATFHI